MDSFSRILIITASFFSIAALTLSIVGIATRSWYYYQYTNSTVIYYNLFTQCTGNVNNGASVCTDILRTTDFGLGTQYAAAFLVVAICLLGCGMLVILLMNFVQLTGGLLFVAPILLFLATLFMVAAFVEASKVTIYNSYSANLVQTSHIVTIFAMGIITFASGRLHIRYYQQF
jgi:hypothetical protein